MPKSKSKKSVPKKGKLMTHSCSPIGKVISISKSRQLKCEANWFKSKGCANPTIYRSKVSPADTFQSCVKEGARGYTQKSESKRKTPYVCKKDKFGLRWHHEKTDKIKRTKLEVKSYETKKSLASEKKKKKTVTPPKKKKKTCKK